MTGAAASGRSRTASMRKLRQPLWCGFLGENRLMEQFCPYYDDEIILELTDEMLSEYAPAYYSLLTTPPLPTRRVIGTPT